jgi:hypothetical protein
MELNVSFSNIESMECLHANRQKTVIHDKFVETCNPISRVRHKGDCTYLLHKRRNANI